MQRIVPLPLFSASLAIAPTTPAPVLDSDFLVIDFTNEKDARAKSDWHMPDGGGINDEGLGGTKKGWITWWIETKPLPIGLYVRPASGASVTVTIKPPPLEDGSSAGAVFARYGPDCKHWSSWQLLSREEKEGNAAIFKGELAVAGREQEKYAKYNQKYQMAHIGSDASEEAVVRWILQQEPRFFDHSIPFIGYIELLFESPQFGTYRIKRLEAEVQWGVGGLGLSGDDLKTRWRFKAP